MKFEFTDKEYRTLVDVLTLSGMILDAYGVKYMGQSKDSIAEEHLRNRERLKERGIIT